MEVPIDKNFENKIREIIKTFHDEKDTELEFRFGKFVRGFHAGVSAEVFKNFLNEIRFHPDFILEETSFTTEIYTNKFRKITYEIPKGKVEYFKKYRLTNLDIDFSEYVCRLSLSREYPVKKEELSLDVIEEKFQKRRWSFTHKLRDYRLDFSIVDNQYYEIELEFLNRDITYDALKSRLGEIYSFISSTNFVLPYLERIRVVESFNRLQGRYEKKYPIVKFNKPINLPRDKLSTLQGNYTISPKLDGVRYFLYIHSSNGYLINHKVVLKFAKNIPQMFNESILDVEKMDSDLHILDLLYFKGVNQTNLFYIDRLNLAKQFTSPNVYMIDYTTNLLDGYFQFINYENIDGVIFTPIRHTYYNNETYKFKPIQTIDFYVEKGRDPSQKVVYLYSLGEGRKLIPFEGSELQSFSGKVVLNDQEIEIIEGGDKIVEFYWNGERFVPMRIREDKETPNFIDVAKSIFNDIIQPITENDLFNNISINKMRNEYEPILSFYYVFKIIDPSPEVKEILRSWIKRSWPSYGVSFFYPLDELTPDYFDVKVKLLPRKLSYGIDIKDIKNKDEEIIEGVIDKLNEKMINEDSLISAVTVYITDEQKKKLIDKIKSEEVIIQKQPSPILIPDLVEQPLRQPSPIFIPPPVEQFVRQPSPVFIAPPISSPKISPIIIPEYIPVPQPVSQPVAQLSPKLSPKPSPKVSPKSPVEEKALVLFPTIKKVIPTYPELDYLSEGKYELLKTPLDNMTGSPEERYRLMRFYAVPDGSCFFHSVSSAIDDDYKALKTSSQKSKYMANLRQKLRDYVNNPQVFASIDNGNIYLFYVWNNFIKTIQKYQKISPASQTVRLFKTELFDTTIFNSLKNINFDDKDPEVSSMLQKLSDTRDTLDRNGKFNVDRYHTKVVDVMSNLIKSKFKNVNEKELRKLLNTIYSKVEEAAIKGYSEQLGDLGCFFNNQFLPILADFFDVDLYIIRAKDGYRMPVRGFCDILKGRTSVVLLQIEDSHYELIGSVNPKTKKADIAFSPDHPLIKKLKHIVCSEIEFLNNDEFGVFYEFYKM